MFWYNSLAFMVIVSGLERNGLGALTFKLSA